MQLGHNSIRGVLKYRDVMVYANPQYQTKQIQENQANDTVFESYRSNKLVSSLTSQELASKAENLWSQ